MPVIGFLGGAGTQLDMRPKSRPCGSGFATIAMSKDELAADLVGRKVAVMITQGTPAAFAAKQATTTIHPAFSGTHALRAVFVPEVDE
jgi:hypothetical protein